MATTVFVDKELRLTIVGTVAKGLMLILEDDKGHQYQVWKTHVRFKGGVGMMSLADLKDRQNHEIPVREW